MAHKDLAFEMAHKILAELETEAIIEQKPQMAGRNLNVTIRRK